jgi:hypothetical protein
MPERETKVQMFPGGPSLDGVEVTVTEANEAWSKVTLEDGTVIKLKPVVTSVVRAKGQYDAEGNPLYIVKTSLILIPEQVPTNLKRPTT